MSQENNTTPSARNREAYAALTEMGGNVPPQAVELEELAHRLRRMNTMYERL